MTRQLATPETVTVPGGDLTATHEAFETTHYSQHGRAKVTRVLGVLNEDGNFVQIAQDEIELTGNDYADLIAAKPDGKQAGMVRSDDFKAAFAAKAANGV